MPTATALAHLDEDEGAIASLHDQIDFATPAPGRPIIALQQAQAGRLQVLQGPVFRCGAHITRAAAAQLCQLLEELH